MAKLVKAGVTLRDQVNKRWPNRDKATDGWLGDLAHQARPSDHNADKNGWVHALDIDEDFLVKNKGQMVAREFADQLIEYAKSGKDGGRLKYVVYENMIASGTHKNQYWVWRSGNWGHTKHIHVSFTSKAQNDGRKFDLPIFNKEDSGALWDGIVPKYENIISSMNNPGLHNLAAYRLAARLNDLGFFKGDPVKYDQGYPWKAMEEWQKSQGFNVVPPGRYGPKAHKLIFSK
jgi:hypothetical protein